MKITKSQLKQIINEELDATINEIGFFKRLGNELTGKTKEASKIASKIWRWMKENDLRGKFGPMGSVHQQVAKKGVKGWKSHSDIFDWVLESDANFETAIAMPMAFAVGMGSGPGVQVHGVAKKGFENDPVIKAVLQFHQDEQAAVDKDAQDAKDVRDREDSYRNKEKERKRSRDQEKKDAESEREAKFQRDSAAWQRTMKYKVDPTDHGGTRTRGLRGSYIDE
tara:strand:+ start:51 stop:722 length:672 start_codon:yes stop_codon:yes gene_type:complete